MLRLIALALSLALATPLHAEEVVVFAAASLKSGLDDFAARWGEETGNTVTISYAGSGQLARQIIAGAPADLYLSANVGWMDEVEKAGLIQKGARADLLGNTLVLIAHGKEAAPVVIGPDLDLVGLLGVGKLAMALVDAVPAGQYGKAALEALGLWEDVAPSVAQTDNVRAALALVSTGEAPFGIVYATDAAASDNVTVAATFPEGSHPPIIYPVALLANATGPVDRQFYDALFGDEARTAFEKQGFSVLH